MILTLESLNQKIIELFITAPLHLQLKSCFKISLKRFKLRLDF
jgi:hypothetical protein